MIETEYQKLINIADVLVGLGGISKEQNDLYEWQGLNKITQSISNLEVTPKHNKIE
jgi:hypothetical protein